MVTRNVALTELPFRGISINAETGSNVVAIDVEAYDSGILFINKETNGTVTYTLPAVDEGKGKMWWFFNANASAALKIASPATDMFASNTTATSVTSATQIGECGFVFGDGTNYYFFETYGDWTTG